MADDFERARNIAADFERAKNFAAQILVKYSLTDPPVDSLKIATNEGIRVVFKRLPDDLRNEVSGFFDPNYNLGKGAIVINEDISPSRMVFTIAHELGHVLLHEDIRKSDKISSVQYRTNNWQIGCKPCEEQEADVFAAHLLMPDKWIRKYVSVLKYIDKDVNPENLSELFGVSKNAMYFRMKDLGLV